MKDEFKDPLLDSEQVKIRFKDGWGTNAMCLKGNPPVWLKDVKIKVQKMVNLSERKLATKFTIKEVAEHFTKNREFVILGEEVEELTGVLGAKFGKWIRVGHIMLQERYWKLFSQKYTTIHVPTNEKGEPVCVFYQDEEPVAVFMGCKGTYKDFKKIAEALDEKLEVAE